MLTKSRIQRIFYWWIRFQFFQGSVSETVLLAERTNRLAGRDSTDSCGKSNVSIGDPKCRCGDWSPVPYTRRRCNFSGPRHGCIFSTRRCNFSSPRHGCIFSGPRHGCIFSRRRCNLSSSRHWCIFSGPRQGCIFSQRRCNLSGPRHGCILHF